MSNCPWCRNSLSKIKVQQIKADSKGRKDMIAYSYACNDCDAVLSVDLHPDVMDALRTQKK
jgi:hypothetical protein